jgi:hypothetical protein
MADMPRIATAVYALNVGEVSRLALARVDLERMRLAAEEQLNFIPQVLGPAMLRPGTEYLTSTRVDAAAKLVPFVFSASVTALLELTDFRMRVLLDGVPLARPSVTASVTNGTFAGNLTGWTDSDEAGATSAYASGDLMSLTGTGSNFAIREQQVTVTETGVEHGLRVTVARGFVNFRVGSSAGTDDLIAETVLREGVHSLAFTPSGNFHIWVAARTTFPALVSSIVVETAGTWEIVTPWPESALPLIRFDQSGDVLFCACDGFQQRRIERRSQRSWSVAKYFVDDGPFRAPNLSSTTITNSSLSASTVLTASRPLFRAGHVGALFRLTHSGQAATADLSSADQFTTPIRVSGLDNFRQFGIVVSGTFTATVTLQRAFGDPVGWEDVPLESYTAPVSKAYADGLTNQIVFYRLGIKTGDYTSGTATALLTYTSSIQTGLCRITEVNSATQAFADVLSTFGNTNATSDWSEGEWSSLRGWPSSVAFHDGRLWWGARDTLYGSVSDAFESFDDGLEGDAGPITRSVATGPFEGIRWLLSLQRFLAGTASQEVSIRSSSFDEPITPTAFTARAASRRGCANIQAIGVDSQGIFVQRDGRRVFEGAFDASLQDYATVDLTRLKPEMCDPGVVAMAVQRQPDTRIWFVLSDGRAALLTYERADEVVAWTRIETTGGAIESVAVLPGRDEDDVYFVVRRTIAGATKRYIERMTKQSEARGGALNKVADCHVVYTGAATATITGLSHLNGRQVVVWANGAPLVTQAAMLTVSGGSVTLPSAQTNVVVGLPYKGRFKSTKLAYGSALGTALGQMKRVDRVGLVMADVGWRGVRVGKSFSDLRGLSTTYRGKPLAAGAVLTEYDDVPDCFNGDWGPDERICVEVSAPYPATIMGVSLQMTTNDAS